MEDLIAECARKIVELLAHEGRIHYRRQGSQVYVSLKGKE